MTVRDLKAKVSERLSMALHQRQLIFGGKQLEDKYTLVQYNIHKESTVSIVEPYLGGMRTKVGHLQIEPEPEIVQSIGTRLATDPSSLSAMCAEIKITGIKVGACTPVTYLWGVESSVFKESDDGRSQCSPHYCEYCFTA